MTSMRESKLGFWLSVLLTFFFGLFTCLGVACTLPLLFGRGDAGSYVAGAAFGYAGLCLSHLFLRMTRTPVPNDAG